MNLLAKMLSSKVRAEMFRLLFGSGSDELHLRELVRRSGLTVGTVRDDLKKMVRMDLVSARRDGNRLYYKANRDHPLYEDMRMIVLKTAGIVDILRERLQAPQVRVAFIFGSIVKGEERAGSDIDLCVVGALGLREVSTRLSGVESQVGREVNPFALTLTEFKRRVREKDHFLTAILAEPKVFIIGDENELRAMGR